MNQCPRCGAPVTPEMKFCEKCGNALGTAYPTVVLSKMEKPEPPKSNKTAVILLSVLCGVLVIALAVMGYILINNDDSSSDDGDTTVTTTTTSMEQAVTQTTAVTDASTTASTVTTRNTTAAATTSKSAVTTTTTAINKEERVTPAEFTLEGKRGKVVTSDGDGVNLRSGPSTEHVILDGIAEETVIDVYAEQSGWYYVEFEDQFGWVSGEFLKLI